MTVPITEAMQMTVSSAMAKRIDDSNSTAERQASEPRRGSMPWVLWVSVVMRDERVGCAAARGQRELEPCAAPQFHPPQ